jgi:hypothetical protein
VQSLNTFELDDEEGGDEDGERRSITDTGAVTEEDMVNEKTGY